MISAEIKSARKGVKQLKKLFVMTIAFALIFILAAVALASMKTLEFPDGAQGKVTFDGKMHNQRLGPGKCATCHGKGIPYKAPGAEGSLKMTMADMNAGKNCGMCHDGTTAFSVKDAANCARCHKK